MHIVLFAYYILTVGYVSPWQVLTPEEMIGEIIYSRE